MSETVEKNEKFPESIESIKNKGNGKSDVSEIVKLEKADIRALQYITEKERRIDSDEQRIATEKMALQREKSEIIQEIQQIYHIDLNQYLILPQEGIARRRPQQ